MQHKIALILCIAILVVVLCLFIPVGHGPVKYRPFNAAYSAINKVALTQGLIKFNTEHATTSLLQLNELCVIQNIPIILSEGTALGAVRDGKLIPWDDDIDIMIEASKCGQWDNLQTVTSLLGEEVQYTNTFTACQIQVFCRETLETLHVTTFISHRCSPMMPIL